MNSFEDKIKSTKDLNKDDTFLPEILIEMDKFQVLIENLREEINTTNDKKTKVKLKATLSEIMLKVKGLNEKKDFLIKSEIDCIPVENLEFYILLLSLNLNTLNSSIENCIFMKSSDNNLLELKLNATHTESKLKIAKMKLNKLNLNNNIIKNDYTK